MNKQKTNRQLSEVIDELFDQEQWVAARKILLRELRDAPDNHWLLTRLGTTYYEQRKYGSALKIAEQALELAPECPLVLWDLAGDLDATGDHEAAIRIYRKLIKRGVHSLANGECGEGVAWAESLIADCWYRLGLCYEAAGKIPSAIAALGRFRNLLFTCVSSLYSFDDVRRHLHNLKTVCAVK
ncbi:MAG TPA: tetratricopeptide repeat protein [Gemmataceae bacterium]|jgi:tetratricopeptide (TPR) repeat protein|nr:tetratricopeptide repeat protein [Gemmataceae bacterium]